MTLTAVATDADIRRQREIARRKKVQAGISTGSAALGAAGLGVLGASIVARKKPVLLKIKPEHAERVASNLATKGVYTSVASTGAGSASSLYFAGTQRREAKMDNLQARRQKLSAVAKRASAAVDQGSPAWKRARADEGAWREYVSPGAQRAYDFALAPSRTKRDTRRSQAGYAAGAGAMGAVGGATAATALRRPRNRLAALGAAAAAAAGGYRGNRALHRKADQYDLASRKIRASGFQRLEDAVTSGYEDDLVRKGLPRAFGGAVASRVVRLPGGGRTLRRGYLVPRRWN